MSPDGQSGVYGWTVGAPLLAWLIFVAAAALEVGGDAVVRKGLRGSSLVTIVAGCLMLGAYGLVVNLVKWDFSKLLGVYVAIFAAIGVLAGRFLFGEQGACGHVGGTGNYCVSAGW